MQIRIAHMSTYFTALFIAAAISLVAASSQKSTALTNIEEEVRRLSDEEVQAFLRKDAEAMTQLWSDDMVVTNPLNKFVSKQDVLGIMRADFSSLRRTTAASSTHASMETP